MSPTFGKRRPQENAADFRERALDLAHKVGLPTEGPDSLFPTDDDLRQFVARARASLDLRCEKVNAALKPRVGPDCKMIPYFLIPESCWTGDTGPFLLSFLRLTPYGEWNTAFLPANQWTSLILGTPVHPMAETPEFTAAIRKLILDCKAETDQAAERVRQTGDPQQIVPARNRALALILTAAKKTAKGLAELGKPQGPDHRAGLAFLSLDCVEYRQG